jgi:hypothetical protein
MAQATFLLVLQGNQMAFGFVLGAMPTYLAQQFKSRLNLDVEKLLLLRETMSWFAANSLRPASVLDQDSDAGLERESVRRPGCPSSPVVPAYFWC